MNLLHVPHSIKQRQRGAALMVMLVIMILGITTFLVGALSRATLQLERDKQAADVLAQAKDALIGRAATNNTPGSLPCPDINNDGISEPSGSGCTSYIGRLPWKTLRLPDLRDASGERLWYALSFNFRDNAAAHINSDTKGTISVFSPDGTQLSDGNCNTFDGSCKLGAVAVIIAPGDVLQRNGVSQNRTCTVNVDCDSSGNTCTGAAPNTVPKCDPVNYLDIVTIGGITGDNSNVFGGSATKGFIQGQVKIDSSGNLTSNPNGNTVVNDHILVITSDQLMPVVETRIAREVRSCLDNYAAASANKYPWAAPVPNYIGIQDKLFGRIPDTPDTTITTTTTAPISSDPSYSNLNSALNNLQTAVNNCTVSDGGANPSNLNNAADILIARLSLLPNPPYTSAFIAAAISAANTATTGGACNNIENNSNYNSIQTNLNSAFSTLSGLTTTTTTPPAPASGMATDWSMCSAGPVSPYWTDWKSFVFFQVDDKYKPSGTLGTPSITINGAGNYRAAVLLSRRPANPAQVPRDPANAATYLEGVNPHAATNPAVNFETHQLIDQPATNDLVLCLDGSTSGNCQ